MRLARVVVFLVLSFALLTGSASAQQVVAMWTDGSGNWSNPANWSTDPVVPNNGAGVTYSVTIASPSSTVSMDLLNDTVDNLSLDSATQLNINSGNTMNLGSSTLGGALDKSSINGSLQNYGTLNLASNSILFGVGALTNDGTLNNNGTISGPTVTNAGTLNNYGEIPGNYGALVINAEGGVFNNYGDMVTYPYPVDVLNKGTFTNDGFIAASAGSIETNGMFTNNGGIEFINGGSVVNFGTSINAGSITFYNGGLGNTGTFNNSGEITFLLFYPNSLTNSGTLNNSGKIDGDNYGITNSGIINNSGTITYSPPSNPYACQGCGQLINSGVVNNGGVIGYGGYVNPSDNSNVYAQFVNSGTVNNSGTINNGPYGQFINSGTVINGGTINNGQYSQFINSGTVNNSGTFLNSGAVIISSTGLLTTSTNYVQTAGSTVVDGTLSATGGAVVNIQGGILSGTGTINGNVFMAGTMMPGDAPGTLTILGNYEQASTGIFYEQMSPYSHAFLDVSGDVTLDSGATLDISLLDGFNPLDLTFSIIDFSTLTGQFANGSSFWDDNYLWDITYRQHEIDVTAVKEPEPGSLLLLGVGSLAIGAFARRNRVAQ